MSLEEDIRHLRERVGMLERRLDEHLLPLIDRVDENASNTRTLEDVFIIPAILLLAGQGDRMRLGDWLADFERRLFPPEEMLDRRTRLRVRYWRKMLAEMPDWHGFEPDGWMEPDPGQRP